MQLDDQLAALVAGELDDDTARALRARAASDPAVARRLARHQELHRLLTGWEAPAMPADARARLDAALGEALDALGDGPVRDREAPVAPVTALPDRGEQDAATGVAGAGAAGAGVLDLGAARARRRGFPAWAPAAAVAAVVTAVVGVGVTSGSMDMPTADVMADGADTEAETAEEAGDESAATGMADESMDDEAADDMDMDDAAGDADVAPQVAALAAADLVGVDLAEGELDQLTDESRWTSAETTAGGEDGDADAPDEESAEREAVRTACITTALERDSDGDELREVWLLATGTYAERDAAFVVLRRETGGAEVFDVFAYDPADCSLLAQDRVRR